MRRALGVVLVLVVTLVLGELAHDLWEQRMRRLETRALELLPHVAQRIQSFRRVKMDGARKSWEIAAREAQYFEDDDQIVVLEPEVSFYLEDDEGVVSMKGHTGTIVLAGRDLERVELAGGIEVRFQNYVMRSEQAVYERARRAVVSPSAVTVTGNGITLHGGRMTVELATQRMRLDGGVETVVERSGRGLRAEAS